MKKAVLVLLLLILAAFVLNVVFYHYSPGYGTFILVNEEDAYISMRYARNFGAGHGLTWNIDEHPVEGYTNFLWVVLLDIVWRISGMEPPDSANYLSLIFSVLSLVLGLLMVFQLSWRKGLKWFRILFVLLAALGVLTNRTFLAWTSSGLETAMFNFFVLLWLYCSFYIVPGTIRWSLAIATAAACSYLTRPDGLLFVTATLLLLMIYFVINGTHGLTKKLAAGIPLLSVPLHFIWRKNVYGEWLPNSYYAKVVSLWPESGIRYVMSFILEYGILVWIGLFLYVFIKKLIAFLIVKTGNRKTQEKPLPVKNEQGVGT